MNRRYAEPLLDILIAGGQLAPGGKIDSPVRARVCVFTCEPMVESIKEHVQVKLPQGSIMEHLSWVCVLVDHDKASKTTLQVSSEISTGRNGENTQILEGFRRGAKKVIGHIYGTLPGRVSGDG